MPALADPPCTCLADGLRPAGSATAVASSASPVSHGGDRRDCLSGGEHRAATPSPAAAALALAARMIELAPDRLSFSFVAGGYEVIVRPAREEPAGTCHHLGDAPPASPATPTTSAPVAVPLTDRPAAGASVPDLSGHFLSCHERLILLALAANPGCKANDVRDECRLEVEASRFWALWANLQHRGLVRDIDGPKSGFQLAGNWVRDMLART